MKTTPKANPAHSTFLQLDARYYYSIGGRWSAKTYEVLADNVIDCTNMPGLRITASRKVYANIRRTLFDDFLMVISDMGLRRYVDYDYTTSPLYIKFWNTADIIFVGIDSPDKAKGISKSHRLIMEECNEYDEMDFETLDMSMRGKGYPKKTYLMHNPVPRIPNQKYWFEEKFDPGNLKPGIPKLFDRQGLGRVAALKTTYKHNHYCPEETKSRLEGYQYTNPELYKLWTLGYYTELAGMILKNIEIHDFEIDNTCIHYNGGDFGYNDPNTLTECYIKDHELYICYEWVQNELDPEELKKEVRQIEWIKGKKRVMCDNARPEMIKLYNSPGRTFIAYPCRKNVFAKNIKRFKTSMAFYLKHFRKIHIHETNCPVAAREFPNWAWETNKDDEKQDIPIDGNDHTIDAVIYSLEDQARRYYATSK